MCTSVHERGLTTDSFIKTNAIVGLQAGDPLYKNQNDHKASWRWLYDGTCPKPLVVLNLFQDLNIMKE